MFDLWNQRSLIITLALNDVKIRYRNSILGLVWTLLEPLLMLSVLYFVFTNIIKAGIENYPLYLLLSLIIWYMFSRSTSMGLSSLLDRSPMIQKTYFRREIVVISSCLTSYIIMVFEFVVFGFFLIALQFVPPAISLLLLLVLIDLFVLTLGISFFLSVAVVYFRDVKFIWQVVLQAGFFLSPVIYQLDMFPENVRRILELNPLVPLLDIAHDLVLYDSLPSLYSVAYLVGTTCLIFIVGVVVFKLKDKKIVEEL